MGLLVGQYFFVKGGFQGGANAGQGMLAELHQQGLGQRGMVALGPDPVHLLFHLGNRGHHPSLSHTRIHPTV
jgi:hypothetical protein